jgi:hypothetical protein
VSSDRKAAANKRNSSLAPKGCFITAEAVERPVWQIGEPQKATREFTGRMHSRFDGYACGFVCTAVRWRICVETARVSPPKQRIDNLARARGNWAGLIKPAQMIGLNFEQTCFNSRRTAQSPQKTGQSQYEFPFHS